MSFSEWTEQKIGESSIEIEDGDRGKNYPKKNEMTSQGYCRFLSTNNLIDDKLDFTECNYISKEKHQLLGKGIVKKDDIVLTTRGNGVGKLALYQDNVVARINSGLVIIRSNPKEIDAKFLYYLFISSYIKDQIAGMMSGSAQPQLPIRDLKKISVRYPELPRQKAIANILSSIDEKIELNNQMNKTLEEMAQALFKRWFVDFEFPNENGEPYKSRGGEMVDSELGMIPKGWEVCELEDLLTYVKQPVKAGEHLKDLPYLPIDTLPMKTLSVREFKSWEEAKSSLISFEKNDILLGAMRVYFHRVCLAPFEGITRTTCFVLRPKDKELQAYLTMKLFDEETINFANSTSKGTTMPYAVWENGLNRMKVVIPTKEVNKKFAEATQGILQSIRDSLFENIYLQEIRDILLPKLMSGEIRVSDIQN